LLPRSNFISYKELIVFDGNALEDLILAYETWVKVKLNKHNAILICQGYTNHHFSCDETIKYLILLNIDCLVIEQEIFFDHYGPICDSWECSKNLKNIR